MGLNLKGFPKTEILPPKRIYAGLDSIYSINCSAKNLYDVSRRTKGKAQEPKTIGKNRKGGGREGRKWPRMKQKDMKQRTEEILNNQLWDQTAKCKNIYKIAYMDFILYYILSHRTNANTLHVQSKMYSYAL